MKAKYLFFLLIPLLTSCNVERKYNGPKIKIEYKENGGLVEATPDFLYEHAITDAVDSIYYIGDDTCAACASLKPQLKSWCEVYHGVIYYIPLESINETNEHYLVDATVGQYYEWTENMALPIVYFFKEGYVMFQGDNENTMSYLTKYVEVVTPNA